MLLLQRNANILPFRMQFRIAVISYVSRFCGEDAVVSSEFAVLAGEPRRPALAEDDVSWDNVFTCGGY